MTVTTVDLLPALDLIRERRKEEQQITAINRLQKGEKKGGTYRDLRHILVVMFVIILVIFPMSEDRNLLSNDDTRL
jgi:p-aminobenzoyl-glutamate transporter AbgT